MRTIILILIFTSSFIASQSQMQFPVSDLNYMPQSNHSGILQDNSSLKKKWSVTSFVGMGAGIGFFNGGNTGFLAAPQFGVQLNRRLTNNLYAFAGVYAAPVFFNINHSFSNAELQRSYMGYPGFNANSLGISSGIQGGLMYVNDAKTFSISGSIGIGAGNYPNTRMNTQKQPTSKNPRQ